MAVPSHLPRGIIKTSDPSEARSTLQRTAYHRRGDAEPTRGRVEVEYMTPRKSASLVETEDSGTRPPRAKRLTLLRNRGVARRPGEAYVV